MKTIQRTQQSTRSWSHSFNRNNVERPSESGGSRRSNDGQRRIEIESVAVSPACGQSQVLEKRQGRNQVENLRVWRVMEKIRRDLRTGEKPWNGTRVSHVAESRQFVVYSQSHNARECSNPTTLFCTCGCDVLRAINRRGVGMGLGAVRLIRECLLEAACPGRGHDIFHSSRATTEREPISAKRCFWVRETYDFETRGRPSIAAVLECLDRVSREPLSLLVDEDFGKDEEDWNIRDSWLNGCCFVALLQRITC